MRAWIRGVPRGLAVLLLLVFIDAAFPTRAGAAQGQAPLTGSVVARASGQPVVDATVAVEGSGAATTTNFPWLYKYRPLWDIVVIGLMLGGTALCGTSLVLTWRVLVRKIAVIIRARLDEPNEDLA
jgi:hypothetical protein